MDLLFEKLKISKQEFLFQFQSHQNFPSALAFGDTLNFLGIKNDAYEIEKEHWNELPNQYITIYNNKFSFVEKTNDIYIVSSEKSEKIVFEELLQNSENLVFIFSDVEKRSTDVRIINKWLISAFLILTVSYSFSLFNIPLFLFNLLAAIGVFISKELFNDKFGIKSNVINTICSISLDNLEQKNSCNKIFSSDKINILGLKLSDFSLVYFLGVLIIGVFLQNNYIFLKCISFTAGLVIIYSLYIQFFIEKTVCKVCLLIISVLAGQILIAYNYFNNNLKSNNFLSPILIFIFVLFLIVYLNDILKEKEKYYKLSFENLRFKKNYSIFKRELQEKQINFNKKNNEFWFGKKDSKIHISLITNPYCGYCKNTYLILNRLFENYVNISFQLRFNFFKNNTDTDLTLLISTFKNIYNNDKSSLLKALEYWHDKNDITVFKNEYKSFINDIDLSGIIDLAEENRDFGLMQTPQIIINNYLFPNLYDREDIFYFIDDLLEDEEILNNNAKKIP